MQLLLDIINCIKCVKRKLTKLSGVNGREMEHLRYSSQGHRGGAIDGDAMATARERTRPSRRSRGY